MPRKDDGRNAYLLDDVYNIGPISSGIESAEVTMESCPWP